MITVQQAEKLILENTRDYGNEIVLFDEALGRVLAEEIRADRDLPPFNRVTMDGIAVKYEGIAQNIKTFKIKATQAAGDEPVHVNANDECIEIMTGAALPESVDTVIRYEDIKIDDGKAIVLTDIVQGQNLHLKGSDKQKGEIILTPGRRINPAVISLIASVGETELRVKRIPRVVILSSGDELVDVSDTPSPYQIRRSNSYMLQAMLAQYGIKGAIRHIPDDEAIIKQQMGLCLQHYDVILISGGISMGKFDYIPQALRDLQVEQVFHKVQQRPGKPFWFGKHHNAVVFAFPGNPVASFMCMQRYFVPWLNASLRVQPKEPVYAVLADDVKFQPALEYYLQVKLHYSVEGQLLATPVVGNGSGDFANLAETEAFIELPSDKNEFKKGKAYKIWSFNSNP
ncbi:molybdopterin molybdotransferase MoeA [Mucilaginibacter panaciglaebae]|uniref:Molybdopterin molybdenumtransferase n=1 Tax=Mucilaginibacter panaciglaebae TaxID=502331 RepID=A0ABP7W9W8_9SPHI